jgi:hypothetical protein
MINSNQFHTTSSIVSSKQLRNLNFFWLGFIIYILSNTLSTSLGSNKIYEAIKLPGLLLMITTGISLIQFKFDNSYLKIIYTLYCIWLFTLIIRGFYFLFDYSFLINFLSSPSVGILYFAPLILLFPKNHVFYKKVFDVIIIFGIFYIIYDILFIKDLINSDRSSVTSRQIVETFSALSFSSGFLLLTYSYHSKKRQLLAIGVTVLALLFAVIRARRGLIFMYGTMIFLSYIFYVFHSKLKLLIIYLTVFIILVGAVYVNGVYKPYNNRIYGFLIERGDEDSRTGAELYFYDDMKTKDWVIGKGIKGEYFCPLEENRITNYRDAIETGYLQTILNGGLISLGLFLLIAIPGIIKGIFYSKNVLSKAAGIWIFMSIINSYPSTVNAFTLQYLLVWISIGICYSKEIRMMPESNMKDIFLTSTS